MTSVYHIQNETNNRKEKKKHNNRHMIRALAFLRQDAWRHVLLKQLCMCLNIEHIIYSMPCSRMSFHYCLSLIGFSRREKKKPTNEFFKVWMNVVCKVTIIYLLHVVYRMCMRWRRRQQYMKFEDTEYSTTFFIIRHFFFLSRWNVIQLAKEFVRVQHCVILSLLFEIFLS
jgi:hypothetical protein